MATTTPNFGWDIPQSTDLVKDGATAIAALGTDIDTALVDLKGGTTGQVLSKASNTDLDFTWVAQDDSNAIQNALLTTTGDTIYASAASTPARLGIGTNGQVLTVSGGIPAWASFTASDPVLIMEQSTYYVTGPFYGNIGADYTPTTNQTYYFPIFLSATTYDRIAFSSGGSFTTTGNVRLGLYNSDTTGKPSTVAFDAGTVSVTAANTIYAITISQTLSAGWYYFAINRQSGTFTFRAEDVISSTNLGTKGTGLPNLTSTPAIGYTQASVTGAFATATSLAINSATQVNRFGLRIQ